MPKLPHTLSFISLTATGLVGFYSWQSQQQLHQLQSAVDQNASQLSQLKSKVSAMDKTAELVVTTPTTTTPTGSSPLPTTTTTSPQLQKELAAIKQQISSLEKQITASAQTQPTTSSSTASTTSQREYVIYLGSGSTINRDWTLIPAAGVTLDISAYRHVKSVSFEAGLSIVSGEVYARLYDQTTQTPFYSTELSNNTSAGTWKTSSSLTLPKGSHYYTVQLKSSNGEVANLVGARLKITAD